MTKTFSRGLVLTLATLCMAAPAVAKDKKPIDPNKRICRADNDTGSIMPKKTCHTVAEWAAIDRDSLNSSNAIDPRGHAGGLGQPN